MIRHGQHVISRTAAYWRYSKSEVRYGDMQTADLAYFGPQYCIFVCNKALPFAGLQAGRRQLVFPYDIEGREPVCSLAFSDNLQLSRQISTALYDLLCIHFEGWVIEEVSEQAFQGFEVVFVRCVLHVIQSQAQVIDTNTDIERLSVYHLEVLVERSYVWLDR